jgi:hypothetical protein
MIFGESFSEAVAPVGERATKKVGAHESENFMGWLQKPAHQNNEPTAEPALALARQPAG